MICLLDHFLRLFVFVPKLRNGLGIFYGINLPEHTKFVCNLF